MDIALLRYPRKSHRKNISIPRESSDLAELLGIVMGDGGINNDWQLVITLNSIADFVYSKYVINLCQKLFNIDVKVRKRKSCNALVIVCTSTSLVDFLVTKGAVRGNKVKQQIDMPAWIENHPLYMKRFVRGVVDTDGCLYIHRHTIKGIYYENIGFCFSNRSRKLIYSVAKTFNKFGIKPHLSGNDYKIYLYSAEAIQKYLNIFGTSNPRVSNVYDKWRGAGAAEQTALEMP